MKVKELENALSGSVTVKASASLYTNSPFMYGEGPVIGGYVDPIGSAVL